MASKVKEVLVLFCILLPYFSIGILIFIPTIVQQQKYHRIKQKGINDSLKLRLDTLQSYDMVMESSDFFKSFTRRELVAMPADTEGLLLIPHKVHLSSGYALLGIVSHSSFAVSFTMSLYQPPSSSWNDTTKQNATGLDFLVLPSMDAYGDELTTTPAPALQLGAASTRTLSNSTAGETLSPGGANISVEIGWLHDLLVARVTITEPATRTSSSATTYTVWIEYAHLWQCLYVAAGEGKERPDEAVAIKKKVSSYSDVDYGTASFGLFSSVGQLMRVNSWSTEVEGSPYFMKLVMDSIYLENLNIGSVYASVIILLAAVGAVAAMSCLGVARYFRKQQRRWKKEQDKLAMVMQSLPGVPTQIDFADISKATANFHETMKLGKGGFSSVYRCRLPNPNAASGGSGSSSSTTTTTMEVAIKKFTRGVQEQRYEDFLSEVGIINRLRHKNIVPLVGQYFPVTAYTVPSAI